MDKYLGLAQIAAQNGHSIKLKGAEITKPENSLPTNQSPTHKPIQVDDDNDG